MEEHRFSCPTQVREFTRYRAHVAFALDRAPAPPVAGDEGSGPAGAAEPEGAGAASPGGAPATSRSG